MERTYRLKGDPFDLDALVELFPRIVQNKEGTHYLQLSSPDEMPDKDALEVVKDELDQMNAILTLQHGSHRRITIDGITRKDPETGKFITVLSLEGGVEARARSRAKVTVRLLKDGVEITPPTPVPTFGEKTQKIANKMDLFQKHSNTWVKKEIHFPVCTKCGSASKRGTVDRMELFGKVGIPDTKLGDLPVQHKMTDTSKSHPLI